MDMPQCHEDDVFLSIKPAIYGRSIKHGIGSSAPLNTTTFPVFRNINPSCPQSHVAWQTETKTNHLSIRSIPKPQQRPTPPGVAHLILLRNYPKCARGDDDYRWVAA